MIRDCIFAFFLNVMYTSVHTLKTIMISRKILKPAYFIVFLEAIITALGFQLIAQNKQILLLLAFSLGRVAGVWLGHMIENAMGIGVVEVTVFAKKEKAKKIADNLRDMGYSVTTHKGYGYAGAERFSINITIIRRELPLLKELLKRYGYEEATMVVREVEAVSGKISVTNKIREKKTLKTPFKIFHQSSA
ncbi:MAG: hypothetical protein PWP45_1251 [Tepidanaerobacteraceae bacterium]|nr:hypothetical protein [Tepidanaerobacteraceae bacterium]